MGFSDASGDRYAAVIHSRVKAGEEYAVRLLVVKGRVIPLKAQIGHGTGVCTIPRLEFESVIFLSDLCRDVKRSVRDIPIKFMAYTSSEVTLAWIRSQKNCRIKR